MVFCMSLSQPEAASGNASANFVLPMPMTHLHIVSMQ